MTDRGELALAERDRVEAALAAALGRATDRLIETGDAHTPLGELAGWWNQLIDDEIMPALIAAYGPGPGLVDVLTDSRRLLLAMEVPSQVYASRQERR